MDFEDLTRRLLIYKPDAEDVISKEVQRAKTSYASQRLLGNSEVANSVKERLTNDLRQDALELKAELAALSSRRKSVINALKLLAQPVVWPLWPEINHLEHEDVMDDLMRVHRCHYKDKLDMLKTRHAKS